MCVGPQNVWAWSVQFTHMHFIACPWSLFSVSSANGPWGNPRTCPAVPGCCYFSNTLPSLWGGKWGSLLTDRHLCGSFIFMFLEYHCSEDPMGGSFFRRPSGEVQYGGHQRMSRWRGVRVWAGSEWEEFFMTCSHIPCPLSLNHFWSHAIASTWASELKKLKLWASSVLVMADGLTLAQTIPWDLFFTCIIYTSFQ